MTNKRCVVLRSKGGNWKCIWLDLAKFHPKSFPGYTFYRSFPSEEEARAYALSVEKDEQTLAARVAAMPRNPDESLLFD
jgi:hypothetical protein